MNQERTTSKIDDMTICCPRCCGSGVIGLPRVKKNLKDKIYYQNNKQRLKEQRLKKFASVG